MVIYILYAKELTWNSSNGKIEERLRECVDEEHLGPRFDEGVVRRLHSRREIKVFLQNGL